MPTFDFDVTEEATNYAVENMQKLVGNAGQEALLEALYIDSYAIAHVHIAGDQTDVEVEYDIYFDSSHPEAIEEILNEGEQAFQEYAERCSDILGLIDEAWKQLG